MYVCVPHRGVLSMRGRDTFKLLQGLFSNDVTKLERRLKQQQAWGEVHDALYAALMTPQGRMVADVFLHLPAGSADDDPEVLVEHDTRIGPQILSFIKKYKLRSKVKIADVTDEWQVGQLLSPALGPHRLASEANALILRDNRAPKMGFRVLSRKCTKLTFEPSDRHGEAYTIHRILQGVPEGSQDILFEHAVPLEVNLDYMGGVDFRKGCYVGQELTARTHHTGVVRKRFLPISLYDPSEKPPIALQVSRDFDRALPKPGSEVRSSPAASAVSPTSSHAEGDSTPAGSSRGRSAGKLYSGVHNIGLACLRLEQVERWVGPSRAGNAQGAQRHEGQDADVHKEGGLHMTVQTPDGSVLAVKPWIPTWWNTRDGHRESAQH
ncbi:Aminomethyltransferase folate-binding domain-containing protein [Tilletiaria anomala UBC 951]|uniref:Aminomethyltransferase folate-binding domain-containing protein n=1 Tax=Tilletiaria anomala (strain ATCC 24038 / CBS 436.72 / UBC 951) TaxID=1037660 RepID=A0A066WPU3_TILAU|nr:Aminomethyltransferase folate-binding domain-containing protein [Tilletiaria anomala UBC 951]KDN52650.1 Aminomethyltransferase folate-binding domain-containing protein [Tilletiaria anomala UBC 951]